MSSWFEVDWQKLFAIEMSIPEILIRGTIGYLGVVMLLRLLPRRAPGRISLSDLLVVMIVAGVVRNPLIGSRDSITEGLAVIAVVLFWSFALDWLSYHVRFVRHLLQPASLVVVRDGKLELENLARELMTEEQLQSQLRQQGVKDFSEVEEARVESDGKISVIRRPETEMAKMESVKRQSRSRRASTKRAGN